MVKSIKIILGSGGKVVGNCFGLQTNHGSSMVLTMKLRFKKIIFKFQRKGSKIVKENESFDV